VRVFSEAALKEHDAERAKAGVDSVFLHLKNDKLPCYPCCPTYQAILEHDKLLVAGAYLAAASVLENEIILREKFDAHMEPIDKLAVAIHALTPASAHAALVEFARGSE